MKRVALKITCLRMFVKICFNFLSQRKLQRTKRLDTCNLTLFPNLPQEVPQ